MSRREAFLGLINRARTLSELESISFFFKDIEALHRYQDILEVKRLELSRNIPDPIEMMGRCDDSDALPQPWHAGSPGVRETN